MPRARIAAAVLALAALAATPLALHLPGFGVFARGGPDAQQHAVFFGRRLEPHGRAVLHGAGQTDDLTFRRYTAAVSPARPMLFMSYVDLKDDLPAFFSGLSAELATYPDFLVPQIGLSLNAGSAATHYEQEVAAGAMDRQIAALCTALATLDRPVFLRIGYEFNGQWNGYQPAGYIAAFRRIAIPLHRCAPQVAAVWDFAPDASAHSYMDFYPGDDAVDWWAINLFAEDSFTDAGTRGFLADALAHRFPVMIGESTPRGHPVTEGQAVVDGWYRPYFDLIRANPQIKAFSYIDWDWRIYPQWAEWGDARIERNPVVLAYYRQRIADPAIRSATTEAATRELLNLAPTKR
jgi:hypothetical protein